MMSEESIGVLEAARAIAAGRRVDWAAIESNADLTESLAGLLRELKVVEGIADVHRSLPDPDTSLPESSSSSSSPSAETAAAASWGSLRLLERVGEGAFGDVFRSWDPRLDREVALKLLRRSDSQHDSVGSLVIDEGRLLARVRHPNIVTVHGADRIDGRVGLWMEFVRGRTLEAVLRVHGPFGAQEAALIGLDVCRALSSVHRAGLIHRDIKAHNVMREDGGRIVLMDFGTGREDLGDPHAELAGTPLYLAPEVFAGHPASARSDIYSVGVLLYHLTTGSYPVRGSTVADLQEAQAQRRRVWLRDERPDLPDRFVQAVERALEADPGERYESAGAMEAALARLVAAPDGADARAVEPALRHRGLSLWGAITKARLAGAALAAAVVVGGMIVSSPWLNRLWGRGGAPPGQIGAGMAPESSTVVRRVTLPTDDSGLVGAPSQDGTLFSLADSTGNVAVMDLATGQVRRVTKDAVLERDSSQFAEFTAISPDNQSVAYAWYALDGKYEVRVIDMEGKHPRVLLRSDWLDYPIPIEWAHSGQAILAALKRTDYSVQLALISVQDGSVHPVKELNTFPTHASLSPNGDFVVYDAPQQAAANGRDIFIVRSDGSDERRLVEHPANDANPVWTPDGQRVLFASDRSGTMDVWSVNVTGGLAQGDSKLVHRNVGRMDVRGLTDAGSYFYYATVGAVEVYQAELAGDRVKDPVAVAPSYSGSNISSVFSLDGRHLAYASRRGLIGLDRGSTTLAIREMQSQRQQEFIPKLSGYLLRSWSPDGRYVLVQGLDAVGRQGIYAIATDDGTVTLIKITNGTVRPDWLPDGRVVFFDRGTGWLVARNMETGAEQLVEDLKAERINTAGGVNGRGFKVSPDGQTLAYTTVTQGNDRTTRTLAVKPLGMEGAVRSGQAGVVTLAALLGAD